MSASNDPIRDVPDDQEPLEDLFGTNFEARAAALEEARTDLRARAERAERELDQARGELGRLRQDAGRDDAERAAAPAAAATPQCA